MKTAQIQTIDVLGKPTTLVGIKFTNGFVMVETSVGVYYDNYDEKASSDDCLERLKTKVKSYLKHQIQLETQRKNEGKPKYIQGELFKDKDFVAKES